MKPLRGLYMGWVDYYY